MIEWAIPIIIPPRAMERKSELLLLEEVREIVDIVIAPFSI
jgi:hypothetical protein